MTFLKRLLLAAAGILLLAAGLCAGAELAFRLRYFGGDAVLRFFEYVPAGLRDPFCRVALDAKSYTGLKPVQKAKFKGRDFSVNSLGFRGPDRPFVKGGGVKRVVVVGTELTMGGGVADGRTYPDLFERKLNEAQTGRRYEVINLSRSGVGIVQMIDTLARFGVRYAPDLILIEFAGWHRIRPLLNAPEPGARDGGVRRVIQNPEHVFFVAQAVKKKWGPALRKRLEFLKKKKAPAAGGPAALPVVSMPEPELRRYFDKISFLAMGKPVLFVVLRPMSDFEKNYFSDELFRKLCREHGFGLIDTYAMDFGRRPEAVRIYPGDESPNARAHEIYAESVFGVIKPRKAASPGAFSAGRPAG